MALRCFVAMAFGREDTDKVYDELIAPTLRDKGVAPIRVDRIEHIDDIDDRIIAELQRCDFVLADLTYARPSVYFEAGFAQRKVPVIYTCRKDHFSPKADDPFGNFRVHFDLQMKNVIPWSSASDRRFAERLAKRITRVVAPLLRAKKAVQMEKKEAEKFAALSLQEKTQHILDICISQLQRARYRGTCIEHEALSQWLRLALPPGPYYVYHPQPTLRELFDRALELEPGWLGTKSVSGVIHAALIHVTPSLTKKKLTTFRDGLLRYPVYNINATSKTGPVKQMLEHIFICSFRKVPTSRVLDSLDDFRLDREGKRFIWVGEQIVPQGKIPRNAEIYLVRRGQEFFVRKPKRRGETYWVKDSQVFGPGPRLIGQVTRVPRRIHIYVLSAIKSEKAFATEFSDVFNRIEGVSGMSTLTEADKRKIFRRRQQRCDRCDGKIRGPTEADFHHKNRDPIDNRPENIRLLHRRCHQELHRRRP